MRSVFGLKRLTIYLFLRNFPKAAKKSREEGKDQVSIQSSSISGPEHHMGK